MTEYGLGEHLAKLAEEHRRGDSWNNRLVYAARGIIANPQAHIDALVEAGVLKHHQWERGGLPYYTVVQPHKHEWRADAQRVMNGTVEIYCASCPPNVFTHNRLPIEVPE